MKDCGLRLQILVDSSCSASWCPIGTASLSSEREAYPIWLKHLRRGRRLKCLPLSKFAVPLPTTRSRPRQEAFRLVANRLESQ